MYKGIEYVTDDIIYGEYIMPVNYKDCLTSKRTCWIGVGDIVNTEWHQVKPETVEEVFKYTFKEP